MPSRNRRSFVAAVGAAAAGSIAGCSSVLSDDPPAGSLRFVNEHDLPHSIHVRVVDVGSRPGDDAESVEGDPVVPPAQRTLTASASVEPGDGRTYDGVFTEPVWYAVRFRVDGEAPDDDAGAVRFHPAPPDEDRGRYLSGKVYRSGEFSWVISTTDDTGRF